MIMRFDAKRIRDQVHGMLAGVAIGDACGMPVETMTRQAILLLNNGQGVINYMNPIQTRVTDTKNLKPGDTSDDWQLTKAVARSLIETKSFDINHQARTHLEELERSTFGWGKGTMQALEQIRSGERLAGEEPLPLAQGKGAGNGVIMKISPLAAVSFLTGESFVLELMELGKLTHTDIRARIAAVFTYHLLLVAFMGETIRGDGTFFQGITKESFAMIENLEKNYISDMSIRHFLSQHLRKIDTSSIESLIATAGVGFTAWQTAAFTYGVYARHPQDFSAAILEAVNAGGDTDTNASVVGALVGATIGYSQIEECWKNIPVMEEVEKVANDLCDNFL